MGECRRPPDEHFAAEAQPSATATGRSRAVRPRARPPRIMGRHLTVCAGYLALRRIVRTTEMTIESTSGHHKKRTRDRSPERLYQKNMAV